tara:strand:+ start:93 stop:332 length:240 start_codon:yes stop_codon:yes gene_type:complete
MKFIFKIIFTVTISLLINYENVFASPITNTDQTDIDNLEKIENSNNRKNSVTKKVSDEDIFGDEQTFPFVAGLGKNAAH